MSSMQSGGVTPEIRQNYSGGRIVFNAIHAWSQFPVAVYHLAQKPFSSADHFDTYSYKVMDLNVSD